MTLPMLVDQSGRPLAIDRELASGGEGAVFTISGDPNRVAKVYHRPPSAQTIEKLAVMAKLANPRLLTLAAWPSELLRAAKTNQVSGFVMPRLIDCQPIQHLYNPVQRLKFFPQAGWTFQVRTAQNLAAAFDEIHKTGCLVGDVNQSNAQVTSQALVRLIDCDSFQVRAGGREYLCEVGVPHYTPPELQGKPLRGLVRTENHDRFGLAVLIYQLLFVGRHPYAGVYQGAGDPSFEQLIAEFRFAQGPAAGSWGMIPPPHTPTFADLPPDVCALFRRSFERGSESGNRPRPVEWMGVLNDLEQNAATCAVDPGHKYWKGAKGCVWCRLASKGGPEYYYGVGGSGATFAVDDAKLREAVRRLEACEPVDFPYKRDRFLPSRPVIAQPLSEEMEKHFGSTFVIMVAIGLCVLAMPLGLYRGFICLVAFAGALLFSVWLVVLQMRSPWIREYRQRRKAFAISRDCLEQIEDERKDWISRYHRDHADLSRVIDQIISDGRELSPQYQTESKRLIANAEAAGRLRHLRLHLLTDADIPKIGAGRKQILASHGIFTAADVDESTILGINGFGDALTGNLMAWRSKVLSQFRFDPAAAVSPGEQMSMTVKFRTRQQQILAELDRQLSRLESLAPNCQAAIKELQPELKKAIAVWEQARADLRLMTGKD